MKVYISCNGLGLGHVGRILAVANAMKRRGDTVIFGSWGPAVQFARKEGYSCYELEAIDWKDNSDGAFDLWGTFLRLPAILFKIVRLVIQERGIISKEMPDAIISDGALAHYSGRTRGIPALYVDHQMDFPVRNGMLRWIIKSAHNMSVKTSSVAAVVDLEPPDNIYPYSVTDIKGVRYTGPLVDSRPQDYGSQRKLKRKLKVRGKMCVIMISGPKHSPIALEKEVLAIEEEFLKMKGWMFIIKAPRKHDDKKNIRYLTWMDDVYEYLKASDVFVSRSGYTTVCDILAFSKKSVLIPQPRQVEQETLAKHLKIKNVAEMVQQNDLKKLPGLIDRTYGEGINMAELERIADKINKYSAKERIIEIIDEMTAAKSG